MPRLAALAVLLATACGDPRPPAGPADARSAALAAAPEDAGVPGVGGPAGIYLTVGDDYRTAHVVVIDGRGARRIPGSTGLSAAPRGDGGAWLAGKLLLFAWDGTALTPMPRPDTGADCCGIFVGPGDQLWAFDGRAALSRWDGAAWETWAPRDLGAGEQWRRVVAGGSRVFAVTDGFLLVFDDGVWTRRPLPAMRDHEHVEHLAATHEDRVVITTRFSMPSEWRIDDGRPRPAPDGRVFTLEDDRLVAIDIPAHHYAAPVPTADGSLLHLIKTGSVRIRGATAERLEATLGWDRAEAITPDGTIWASRGQYGGVTAIGSDGARREPAPLATLEAFVHQVVADDRGRVWVTLTPGGLAVIEDGVTTVLPTGSLDGLDGMIQSIAIPRRSPALPAWPAPRTASLHGRLVDGRGRPARGADVQVCWARFAYETYVEPCGGGNPPALHRVVTTGADGSFRLDGVPAGALAMFGRAKRRGRWYALAAPTTASGPTDVDLGELTLAAPARAR